MIHNAVEHVTQRFLPRQGQLDHGDFPLQFRREDQPTTENDEGLLPGLPFQQHVFELPDNDGVRVRQEQVGILEQEDRALGLFTDALQDLQRVVGVVNLLGA